MWYCSQSLALAKARTVAARSLRLSAGRALISATGGGRQ
jgi:hypothetical protein